MKLSVTIGKLTLRNPVTVASGTFGYAEEYAELIDLKKIGAIVTKTITAEPRPGNPPPRLAETPAGMINAIGLQNEGIEDFIQKKLPLLRELPAPVIVSISGCSVEEFVRLAKCLGQEKVEALELNFSCPNVKGHTLSEKVKMFAQDADAVREVTAAVRKAYSGTIIAKLSPAVTDITEIAKAAENGGCDALSLINTLPAMAVDLKTRRPALANITGGLSGPAIKPVALKMVYDVYRAVKCPIIGMGGIMTAEDALEFIIAGATAVSIGTASFVDPRAAISAVEGIEKFCEENKISDIAGLRGSLKT